MVRYHKIYRTGLSQDVAHGVRIVGVEQTRTVAHDRHRSGPVEGHIPLVTPPDLRDEDFSSQMFNPTGELDIVNYKGTGVAGAEGYPPTGHGDGPDAPPGLLETGGRPGRVYASTPRILFHVRWVAEVMGDAS